MLCTMHAKPAICAVQLMPRPNRTTQLEDWLCEGRGLLEQSLHARRPADSVPKSAIIGPRTFHSPSCYQWIHIPSSEPGTSPDTVAIVFTRADDLHLWRSSAERRGWLARGAELAADGDQLLVDAEKITLQRDDGSLGGWLPSRDGSGSAESQSSLPPPPSWKVAATVLLPMFCVQECNRALVLPALATTEAWTSLPPSVQMFCACSWTAGTVTMLLLPHARSLVERIGFIGGARGCPDVPTLARSGGVLLFIYGSVVALAFAASETFGSQGKPYNWDQSRSRRWQRDNSLQEKSD
jgi:antibiotic biosynthesis monooxygenase (ABM) superfamily enzyme